LQRQYQCGSSICRRKCSALDILEQEWIPSFMRNSYPVVKSGETLFTTDLVDTILDDTLSAKTLEEIGTTVKNFRYKEYMDKRLHYYSMISFLHTPGTLLSSLATGKRAEEFSSFEDPEGFNEIAQPDVETIKRFFVNYVSERREILNACLENVIPFGAVSFDSTFHIQKRTKVMLVIYYYTMIFSCNFKYRFSVTSFN